MNRRTKQIGVFVGLVAICIFATWSFWKSIKVESVSETVRERTRLLVEGNAQLQPTWEKAMKDDVLTQPEVDEILKRSEEKIIPKK